MASDSVTLSALVLSRCSWATSCVPAVLVGSDAKGSADICVSGALLELLLQAGEAPGERS